MMRRMLSRALVLVTIGVAALVGTATAAQAFTTSVSCTGSARTVTYRADSGSPLGTVRWQSSGSTVYLTVIDGATGNGASIYARVEATTGGLINYGPGSYTIYYAVNKYRTVWNGYGSSWFTPYSC